MTLQSGFIQDFELGGKQDGSRMIVAWRKHAHAHIGLCAY